MSHLSSRLASSVHLDTSGPSAPSWVGVGAFSTDVVVGSLCRRGVGSSHPFRCPRRIHTCVGIYASVHTCTY